MAKNEGNDNYNSIEKSIAINVSYVTGIEKLDEDQKQLIAYPNPVINKLTIKGLKDNESIKLYNASGQIILADVADGNKKQLNLSHLKSGIYILRTQSGSTLKLLKQ